MKKNLFIFTTVITTFIMIHNVSTASVNIAAANFIDIAKSNPAKTQHVILKKDEKFPQSATTYFYLDSYGQGGKYIAYTSPYYTTSNIKNADVLLNNGEKIIIQGSVSSPKDPSLKNSTYKDVTFSVNTKDSKGNNLLPPYTQKTSQLASEKKIGTNTQYVSMELYTGTKSIKAGTSFEYEKPNYIIFSKEFTFNPPEKGKPVAQTLSANTSLYQLELGSFITVAGNKYFAEASTSRLNKATPQTAPIFKINKALKSAFETYQPIKIEVTVQLNKAKNGIDYIITVQGISTPITIPAIKYKKSKTNLAETTTLSIPDSGAVSVDTLSITYKTILDNRLMPDDKSTPGGIQQKSLTNTTDVTFQMSQREITKIKSKKAATTKATEEQAAKDKTKQRTLNFLKQHSTKKTSSAPIKTLSQQDTKKLEDQKKAFLKTLG